MIPSQHQLLQFHDNVHVFSSFTRKQQKSDNSVMPPSDKDISDDERDTKTVSIGSLLLVLSV
jgi:hypothetical protein